MTVTEQLKAAKEFQFKTSALNGLLNERDGFDPVNDGFHAKIFSYAYPHAEHYNRIMTQYTGHPVGIEYKHKSNDQYTMITPDSAEPGLFRLSFFDKQGFYSHSTHDTIPETVEEMVHDGFFNESKGILSKLQQSPEFEIGNRVSTLIGQFNMGKITHQEFSDQRQAVHDDIDKRLRASSSESDLNAPSELVGSRPTFSLPKKIGDTMNMITNDRGETVAAVGNEISIARAKVRWPNLIEATQELFKTHPRETETELVNQIAAQNIKNIYEAQAVMDAALMHLTADNVTSRFSTEYPRIVINPEKYSAMFAPTKFKVGDSVTFINDYEVVFENKTISGVDKNYGKETRYSMERKDYLYSADAQWCNLKEKNLTSLTLDQIILEKLERIFPKDKQDIDGEMTINLFPPNGRDFYECVSIHPVKDDDNLFPPNSFHIKHYTASPATNNMISDSLHVKHEFTFSVNNNKIEPFWMQNGATYHDLLPPQKSNSDHIKSPNEIKHELNQFVSSITTLCEIKQMVEKTISDKILTECKQSLTPKYPQLSGSEVQELSSFTKSITQHYPEANPETLHRLCTIASDMTTYTIQNERGTLSNEKYNSLTDNQEKQVTAITTKVLPGAKALFSYDPTAPAIKLNIPSSGKGHIMSTYNVPEIPKNKLAIEPVPTKTATEIVSKKR